MGPTIWFPFRSFHQLWAASQEWSKSIFCTTRRTQTRKLFSQCRCRWGITRRTNLVPMARSTQTTLCKSTTRPLTISAWQTPSNLTSQFTFCYSIWSPSWWSSACFLCGFCKFCALEPKFRPKSDSSTYSMWLSRRPQLVYSSRAFLHWWWALPLYFIGNQPFLRLWRPLGPTLAANFQTRLSCSRSEAGLVWSFASQASCFCSMARQESYTFPLKRRSKRFWTSKKWPIKGRGWSCRKTRKMISKRRPILKERRRFACDTVSKTSRNTFLWCAYSRRSSWWSNLNFHTPNFSVKTLRRSCCCSCLVTLS